jgi:hypothetical protein
LIGWLVSWSISSQLVKTGVALSLPMVTIFMLAVGHIQSLVYGFSASISTR